MDDEWNPEPEQRIDAHWLEREQERLREHEAAWEQRCKEEDEEEVVNGARRADDGRFKVSHDRICRTDGTSEIAADELEELLLRVRVQAKRARTVSPSVALDAARAMRRLCDELEYEAVAIARGCGWSWLDIGEALGISESGAHRRFAGSLAPRLRQRRRG